MENDGRTVMNINNNSQTIEDKQQSIVYILWTGGWDSTFRIVELSRIYTYIQPIYVIDPNRKSKEYEIDAMNKIIKALQNRKETRAKFFPIKFWKLEDIPQDEEISRAYKTIHSKTNLGSQHEWLAWLGKIYPGMEMGTEAGIPETSHIIDAISRYCDLEIIDGIGRIKPETSTKEGNLVLGWFTYPIIMKTERDMVKQIRKWGYEDIMKLIWFCHRPIAGKPCGFCHPCEVKIESDMEWLLSPSAIKNYMIHKKIQKIAGTKGADYYEKIYRRIIKR